MLGFLTSWHGYSFRKESSIAGFQYDIDHGNTMLSCEMGHLDAMIASRDPA